MLEHSVIIKGLKSYVNFSQLIKKKKTKIFPLSTGLSWNPFPKSHFSFKENILTVCLEGLEGAHCEMYSVLLSQGAYIAWRAKKLGSEGWRVTAMTLGLWNERHGGYLLRARVMTWHPSFTGEVRKSEE